MSIYRIATLCFQLLVSSSLAAQDVRTEASAAMRKAGAYYHAKASHHGGYVYFHTPDLKEAWGEGKAGPDTLFVQPPGTPTVGMAFLRAYEATQDKAYLDAAREAAEALVYGQLQSGGWTQTIEFGKAKRVGRYRNGKGGGWNASSLDDGQTQAALIMLMWADRALDFKHDAIHEASLFALDALLKAQFPNGAFPQVWTKPVDAHPVQQAKYPDYDWKTEGRVKNYWDYYTLNDGLAGTVAEVLMEAHAIYKDAKLKAALAKLGDFLLLARMPGPQPGWCQQYNFEMVPIWARKFEPPAITGWESQDAMDTLIRIAAFTGEAKYLEPIPASIAYFRKALLPDGRVARYYELKTNKPLYMDAAYQLTYDDSAAPQHYGWKQPARLDAIERKYKEVKAGKALVKPHAVPTEADVRKIIQAMDGEGRWITTYAGERLVGQPKFAEGFRYISSEVFSRNLETLAAYIKGK